MSGPEVQEVKKGKKEVKKQKADKKEKGKYVVKCNGKEGIFSLSAFHSGFVGKSIEFGNKRMTPSQFEKVSGSKSKKYKRSLKISGETLGKFLERNHVKDPTRKRICEMGICKHFD